MKNRKFISALLSLSMLASVFSMTAAVHAEETAETPTFTEDFSSYGDDFAYKDAQNALTIYDHLDTVIATNPSGAEWVTSSYINKPSPDSGNPYAYVDVANDRLAVTGTWQAYYGAVKLRLPEKMWAVNKMKFRTETSSRTGGMKLFLSGNEKNYLFVGQQRHAQYAIVNNAVQYQPFVFKVSGNNGHVINGATHIKNAEGWTENDKIIDWTVEVLSDARVKITAVGNGGGNFEYTVDDAQVKNMVRNCAYPLAVLHIDDGSETRLSNVKLWYDADKPTFFDDFSGYTADNLGHTYTSADNKYKLTDGAFTLATHESGAKWTTSNFYNGKRRSDNMGWGFAYVAVSAQKLAADGWGNAQIGAVNLDLGKIEKVSKLKFTTVAGARTGGALAFISEDEKSSLILGQQRDASYGGYTPGMTADNLYNPFVNYSLNRTDIEKNSSTNIAVATGWETTKDTSIKWTITVSDDNVLDIEAIGNNGGYWKTTIDNTIVKNLVANTRYTVAPFAVEGGFTTTIDDVAVWYTPYVEPTIDFDFRTLDAAQPVAAGTITYDYGNKQLLATDAATGAKWYTSEVYCGQGDQQALTGYDETTGQFITTKLNGTAAANSSGLAIVSKYQADVAANMDYKLKDISKITAVTGGPGSQTGVRFLVSEDEKSYYELRFGRYGDNSDADQASTTLSFGSPRFIKVVNETEAASAFCDAVWGSTGSDYTWNIDFDGNKININVVSGTKSWDYTYTDTDIASMMSESKYPVSWVVKGDGASTFKDVAIWGTPVYDAVKDNGDGTVTATIQDGIYENTDTINEVVAFYNAAGDMINSQMLTSDGKTFNQKEITKPDGTTSVKAFVFDGDPKNGKLLNAVSYEDEVSEVSANPIKVACVGDSLTAGHGSSDNNKMSYPAQLQRMLGRGYNVRNFGIGSRTVCSGDLQYIQYNGYRADKWFNGTVSTTVEHKDGTKETYTLPAENIYDASKNFKPNIVVIQLGTNDRGSVADEAKRKEFEDVYGSMIDAYKALGADVYVVVPPIADGSVSSANNQNIVNYIKPILEGFVKTKGVKMINMQYGPTTAMYTDGLHFNDTGYNVMAKTIYDAIMDKTEYSYSGNKISIKPAASVYGVIAAAAYDNSGLSGLVMLDNGDKTIVQPNVATEIDTSSIVTGAAAIKLMAWDGFDTMKPIAKIGEKTAEGYSVSGGVTTVTGKAAPNSSVVITAYDAGGNLVYVNNVLSDYDSDYSFSFAGNSASVYVNGTAVSAK